MWRIAGTAASAAPRESGPIYPGSQDIGTQKLARRPKLHIAEGKRFRRVSLDWPPVTGLAVTALLYVAVNNDA